MIDSLRRMVDKLASFTISRVDKSKLLDYERTLLALSANVDSALMQVLEQRNRYINMYFKQYGFRLSRRRMKCHYRLVFNRNITDISFLAFIPSQIDEGSNVYYPQYLDQPVSLHVYGKDSSKLIADWGVFANVDEAMARLPQHYKDIR